MMHAYKMISPLFIQTNSLQSQGIFFSSLPTLCQFTYLSVGVFASTSHSPESIFCCRDLTSDHLSLGQKGHMAPTMGLGKIYIPHKSHKTLHTNLNHLSMARTRRVPNPENSNINHNLENPAVMEVFLQTVQRLQNQVVALTQNSQCG